MHPQRHDGHNSPLSGHAGASQDGRWALITPHTQCHTAARRVGQLAWSQAQAVSPLLARCARLTRCAAEQQAHHSRPNNTELVSIMLARVSCQVPTVDSQRHTPTYTASSSCTVHGLIAGFVCQTAAWHALIKIIAAGHQHFRWGHMVCYGPHMWNKAATCGSP